MGCGCNKKKLPTAPPVRWASLVNKTYRNDSDETLKSRNPRLEIAPGDTIELEQGMITYSIRTWIRTGALVFESVEESVVPV